MTIQFRPQPEEPRNQNSAIIRVLWKRLYVKSRLQSLVTTDIEPNLVWARSSTIRTRHGQGADGLVEKVADVTMAGYTSHAVGCGLLAVRREETRLGHQI